MKKELQLNSHNSTSHNAYNIGKTDQVTTNTPQVVQDKPIRS